MPGNGREAVADPRHEAHVAKMKTAVFEFDGARRLSMTEAEGLRSVWEKAQAARHRATELLRIADDLEARSRECFAECCPDADLAQPFDLDPKTRELRYRKSQPNVPSSTP